MSAPRTSRVLLGVLASMTSACGGESDPCDAAVAAASACGVPMTGTACHALPAAARKGIADGLAKLTCDATTTEAPDAETCRLAGWPCPRPLGPESNGHAPKYPIVFVSGIDDGATFDWNPAILRAVVDRTGASVARAVLPSWASTDERAAALWSALVAHGAGAHDAKFNLVCYAVGGLDCRDLASPAGLFADDPSTYALVRASIASITTISTPHRGTRVADAAVLALDTGNASELLAGFGVTLPGPVAGGALLATLRALSLGAAASTSERLVDGNGILYQSFAGVSHVAADATHPSASMVAEACADASHPTQPPFFGGGAPIDAMQAALVATASFGGASLAPDCTTTVGPTDGMVSVASAKWGRFRGCLPADHYHVVGQIGRLGQDVRTGFDARRFYSWLASDLADGGL